MLIAGTFQQRQMRAFLRAEIGLVTNVIVYVFKDLDRIVSQSDR